MRVLRAVSVLALLMVAAPSLAAQANGCGLEYQNMINAENLYWDSIDYAYSLTSPDALDIMIAQYMIDSSYDLWVYNGQQYFSCSNQSWPA